MNKSRASEHRYRRKDITVSHKAQQEHGESGIYFHAWHHALSSSLLCLSDSFRPLPYGQLLCRCHYAVFPFQFHILRFSQPGSRVSAFSNCQNYPRPKKKKIEAISQNELNSKLKVHMWRVRNAKLLFSSLFTIEDTLCLHSKCGNSLNEPWHNYHGHSTQTSLKAN